MAKKVDWAKIRGEYLLGCESCDSLARRYGLSVSAVKKRCAAENWVAEKARMDTERERRKQEAVSRAECRTAVDVFTFAGRLLDDLYTLYEQEPELSVEKINAYTGSLKNLKDIRGDRDKLTKSEVNARIGKLRAETERVKADTESKNPENNAVTVTVAGEASEYAG